MAHGVGMGHGAPLWSWTDTRHLPGSLVTALTVHTRLRSADWTGEGIRIEDQDRVWGRAQRARAASPLAGAAGRW